MKEQSGMEELQFKQTEYNKNPWDQQQQEEKKTLITIQAKTQIGTVDALWKAVTFQY